MIRVEPEKKNHSPSCAVVNQLGEHERDTSSGSKNQNGNHFEWSLIPFAHSFTKTGVFRCGNVAPAAIVISGKGGRWLWSPSSRHSRGSSRSFQRCEGNDTFTRVGRTVFLVQPPSSSAFFGSSISAKRKWFSPPSRRLFQSRAGTSSSSLCNPLCHPFLHAKVALHKVPIIACRGKVFGNCPQHRCCKPHQ